MSKPNIPFEEEINKQMDQMDQRGERSGWFYIFSLIVLFFALIYIVIQFFKIPSGPINEHSQSTNERLDYLESRVKVLEDKLNHE